MTDDDSTDDLGTLFESITGDTSVVEPQREEASSREIEDGADGRSVDAVEHHGFADVIDGPEAADTAG